MTEEQSPELTAEIVKREPSEIVSLPAPSEDVVVLARNPDEMRAAQQGLINWFEHKIAAEKAQLAECEENLATAKRMKVRTQGWTRQVSLSRNRVRFYEKGLEALHEGYCIIPDFPIQLIAVRTSKPGPPRKANPAWRGAPDVPAEQLPQGEGKYVSPEPYTYTWDVPGAEPSKTKTFVRASAFREVDFPFKLVKPQILKDLDAAMKAKLFDEIGVLPGRVRNPDPVLVGRITRREASRDVSLNFLISWWIDSRTL